MKNSKNNQVKSSFKKFNTITDKKQLNTLFGGCGGTVLRTRGIIGPVDHL